MPRLTPSTTLVGVVVGALVGVAAAVVGTAAHLATLGVGGVRLPVGAVVALTVWGCALTGVGLLGPVAVRAAALAWVATIALTLPQRREGDYLLLPTAGRTLAWLGLGLALVGWALVRVVPPVRVVR